MKSEKTYRPINGYSKQVIKDALAFGTKGRVSAYRTARGDTVCALRGEAGNKCAIGCFIPDSLCSPKLEKLTVQDLYIQLFTFMPLEINAMNALQSVHDSADDENVLDALMLWVEANVAEDKFNEKH